MAPSKSLVGTCSWTDRTLTHDTDWYPKRSMSAAERLAYYASKFSITEADSTYYFPPSPDLTRGWAERTPDDFTMNVKAYSLLTGHPTRPDSLWPDLREAIKPEFAGKRNVYASHLDPDVISEAWIRFEHALRPLVEAGKLGAVLMQYPEWFTAKKDNRAALTAIRDHWADLPICVEFRSPTWLATAEDRDRTLHTLTELHLALVVVDAPKVSKLRTVVEATSPDLAVVRFHAATTTPGRSRAPRQPSASSTCTPNPNSEPGSPRSKRSPNKPLNTTVHALMNNCYEDYGVHNAADLADLLQPI
jgi:uncharacterized protein YecE (DUF72 family)